MSVFDVGDYRIQQMNQGWKVSWQDLSTSIRHHLDLNIEWVIREHIETHLRTLTRLVYLMKTGPEQLLDDPVGCLIIINMPDSETIPGMKFTTQTEADEWYAKQLIQGYNNLNATSFTYEMIRDRL